MEKDEFISDYPDKLICLEGVVVFPTAKTTFLLGPIQIIGDRGGFFEMSHELF